MAKRHKPLDLDYYLSSTYYEDVRAEMMKAGCLTVSKDADTAKQAEPMGLTAQECAALIIRNRSTRKRGNPLPIIT